MSAASKSVVVCGGGIIGLACAYYLARDGHRVTVLERGPPDHDHCVLGSAGYVSPSHMVPLAAPGMVGQGIRWMLNPRSPFFVKPRLDRDLLRWSWLFARACRRRNVERGAPLLRDLALGSRALFEELDELTGRVSELEKHGLLNLCKTPATLEHEAEGHVRIARELGVEARVLDAAQVAAMEPGLRFDVAGAVYFPIDSHLTPARFATALTRLIEKMGVRLQFNTTVHGWRAEHGKISAVQTTTGELVADEFVLAGGSWSPSLVAGLGISLPLQAGKGYSLTIARPRLRPKHPMIFTEARVAMTPMGDALRFGGTMELSGINAVLRPERVRQIVASVARYLPDFREDDFAGTEPWCGLRPVTPDGLPYLGRFGRHRNLIAATGHAMLGLTLAPMTGRLVADVVSNRKPAVSLEYLNPDRYA